MTTAEEVRVNSDLVDPVGVAEISERLGVPRSSISMAAARRETSGFPEPRLSLKMGPVYEWSEVRDWYAANHPGWIE